MPPDSIVVLHVEDDPDLAELTATFLEREDDRIEVVSASGPNEGLDALADRDVDCVVSDYDMPEANGIEFLEAVRNDRPRLPFILFTGKGSEEIASDAITAGVTDYLQKRGGREQYALLANRISNAVGQSRAERRAEGIQERLLELTDVTNDVLWMFTDDWSELRFVNSAYEDIWGLSIEALREDPTDFLDGIHPDDCELVRGAMDRLSAGESVDIEYRVNPGEDFGRYVWVQGEPIVEDGEVVRVAGFARDVTDRERSG